MKHSEITWQMKKITVQMSTILMNFDDIISPDTITMVPRIRFDHSVVPHRFNKAQYFGGKLTMVKNHLTAEFYFPITMSIDPETGDEETVYTTVIGVLSYDDGEKKANHITSRVRINELNKSDLKKEVITFIESLDLQ